MNTQEIEELARFWSQVQVDSNSSSHACWTWLGARNPNGYGVFGARSGPVLAHRYVQQLRGEPGEVVRHRCDNPSCVRPDHLDNGTQAQNMHDMLSRGRKNSKLTLESVQDIRTHRLTRPEFAKLYGISVFTVGQVQRRETWAWLT